MSNNYTIGQRLLVKAWWKKEEKVPVEIIEISNYGMLYVRPISGNPHARGIRESAIIFACTGCSKPQEWNSDGMCEFCGQKQIPV